MKNQLNDDFLLRLRTEPNKKFLSMLKANLDRQSINQKKARRTLLRTAILAAFIGGSAVAVAFAVLRGSPAGGAPAHIIAIGSPQSGRSGGGAAKGIAAPAQGGIPVSTPSGAEVAEPAAKQSRGALVIAGPTAVILNAQEIARRWTAAAIEFNLTSSTEALAMFCRTDRVQGVPHVSADIAGTSRRILPAELEACKSNGVTHVAEVHSGYESVVLARSRLYGAPKLSARDIFMALAAEVPDPNRAQTLIKNPYRTWNAVDGALLEEKIEVLGPPPASATMAAFRQTLMEAGCATFPWLAALQQTDLKRYEKVCRTLREDGIYRSKVDKVKEYLETYPNSLALLDFRDAAARPDTFAAASVDGIEPGIDTIVAEQYAGSRAMFIYVNTERFRVIGISSFVDAYRRSVSESWSIATLVAPQRQADARPYPAPLQEMKF